jgi:hypothetical protein
MSSSPNEDNEEFDRSSLVTPSSKEEEKKLRPMERRDGSGRPHEEEGCCDIQT